MKLILIFATLLISSALANEIHSAIEEVALLKNNHEILIRELKVLIEEIEKSVKIVKK